jgi:two-component system KDP operon response regulator KdpE
MVESTESPGGRAVKVLVVDDEKSIRRFLRASLQSYGYEVSEAASAREGRDACLSSRPDILILDLGLPDRDGVDVIKELRKSTHVPIIVLTVREQEPDKIAALDAGADDYLTKPFHIGELLARLRAVFRRSPPGEETALFQFQGLSVDFARRVVEVNGTPVHLTPIEYSVLRLLIQNAGKVVTHRQIFREIWDKDGHYEGIDHLLRVTISNLRNKIETDPQRPTYILTEPGVGYRLHSSR